MTIPTISSPGPRRPRCRVTTIAVASLLALVCTGCYTLLQHPAVEDNFRLQAPDRSGNCLACHESAGFDANIWGTAHQSPAARMGGYQFFQDYPWWWAEPATIARVMQDSSRTVTLPEPSTTNGLAGIFNRLRTLQHTGAADTSRTSASPSPAKDEEKATPEFRRRRR